MKSQRTIAVFTGSRADYGLLYWLMKDIEASKCLRLEVIVGGMHLQPEFGSTWQQVKADGFPIAAMVDMQLASDRPGSTARSVGLGIIGLADCLERLQPDMLVVLGDRYEALAAAQVAHLMRIPIAHLHGGELTEGAYDDAIRHAITKFSHLHFVATNEYRRRVIQLGESPDSVYTVGAFGLEHLTRTPLLNRTELSAEFDLDLRGRFFVATYHPVTLLPEETERGLTSILDTLDNFSDIPCIITYPNADDGYQAIVAHLKDYAAKHESRIRLRESLGSQLYLSLLAKASVNLGNSSSGLIEAPALGVPAIDIGSRQQGRLRAKSVIHSPCESRALIDAVSRALDPMFLAQANCTPPPYRGGDTSTRVVRILESVQTPGIKHFHSQGEEDAITD